MNEEQSYFLGEEVTPSTPEESTNAKAPLPPVTWRDIAAPFLALALAVLYWEAFAFVRMAEYGFPHLGVLVFVAAYFAVILFILGRQTKWTVGGTVCMAASLVLALSCALYAIESFAILNCFVILLTAAMATFSLSGQAVNPCGRVMAIPEAVKLSFLALFSRVSRPFQVAGQVGKDYKNNLGRVALSVAIAVPVLAVVLWLLASADAVFGSLFQNIRFDFPTRFVWRPVRAVVLALFIASGLYFIRETPAQTEAVEKRSKERHVLPFLLITVLLNIVYIIFCIIQIKYLFGKSEAAAMAGGWAYYAREGFFQLVAVAFINLGLCLLAADEKRYAAKGGMVLRVADGLLLILTAIILASAFRRMQLYILAYGLSVLRLETLWAMAVIAVGIVTAAWKLYRPGFGFFRVAGGFALGLWCLMCLANPGGMIARYNVDHYLSGQLETVDTYYLYWTAYYDALPAYRDLEAAVPDDDAGERAGRYILDLEDDTQWYSPWTCWSLSAARARYMADKR